MSNMPKRYQFDKALHFKGPTDAIAKQNYQDLEAYAKLKAWEENVLENVQEGKGLFLVSKTTGNAKTTWACKIMNKYFRHVALTNNLRCRGLFVNVPEFFRDLKDSFDNPSADFREFMSNIKTADIVIWDDIGTESPTRFVRDTLYVFLNHREANGLSNIYTSNVLPDIMQEESYLGPRIVSRLQEQCKVIEFFGTDRRVTLGRTSDTQ
jgi:DNA replication protein DnaC